MSDENCPTESLSTADQILAAARAVLRETGFTALSTRKVADRAGVPLSQIHYHFGSKEQLILSLLRSQDASLVKRQSDLFAMDIPLSQRWDRTCDYLDDDLESGYVRVLQELMAAGWSNPDVRDELNATYANWIQAHTAVVTDSRDGGFEFGPFTTPEIVALIHALFLGAESMLLLDREGSELPIRQALRRVGEAIGLLEAQPTGAMT